MTKNNEDYQAVLYGNLNREKLLSTYLIFHCLKYRNPYQGYDTNGGFVNVGHIPQISKQLNISVSHLKTNLRKFVNLGWAKRTRTGYVLVGWRYFRKYSPNLEKITIFDSDKTELLIKIAEPYIKNNIKKQVFAKYKDLKTAQRLHKQKMALMREEEFSVSVRKVADILGFKSPTQGTKFQKMLEKRGVIGIVRRSRFVCLLNEYSALKIHQKQRICRCFIVNGEVYERLRNNIIPIVTKADFMREKDERTMRKSAMRKKIVDDKFNIVHESDLSMF